MTIPILNPNCKKIHSSHILAVTCAHCLALVKISIGCYLQPVDFFIL